MDEEFKELQKDPLPVIEKNSDKFERNVESPEIDKAVDQIVNEESDQLLEAEDAKLDQQFETIDTKKTLLGKIGSYFRSWWQNRRLRWVTIIGIFLFAIVAIIMPYSRYALLNSFGVRVNASMVVVDSQTGLPLRNINVILQDQEATSNQDGYVEFSNLKIGRSELKIEKLGYAPLQKFITLGWGSNPLADQPIVATGVQYNFKLVDWKSEKPIKNGEAISGLDVAISDDSGRVVLTIGELKADTKIKIQAKNYRSESFVASDLSSDEITIAMIPSKKHVFISNRDGKYDLYRIDADGKNEKLLVQATGKEREIPYVLNHPDPGIEFAAFISSRDGDKNKDNFVLDGLYSVDTKTGEAYKITRSEQLQVIGWSGNKLIYVAVSEGVSAGNSQRSKLISFDISDRSRTEIASANYFNDVKLIDNKVYYAVSSYAVPQSQAKLYRSDIDGKNITKLVDSQVWSINRTDLNKLLFSAIDKKWFTLTLGQDEVKKIDTEPASNSHRKYIFSPDNKYAVRTEIRDGKGVILLTDIEKNKEGSILVESGVSDPLFWLSDSTLVYRVETSQESADYIVGVDGENPQKLSDVIGNRSRYFY